MALLRAANKKEVDQEEEERLEKERKLEEERQFTLWKESERIYLQELAVQEKIDQLNKQINGTKEDKEDLSSYGPPKTGDSS